MSAQSQERVVYLVYGDVETYQSLVLPLSDAAFRRVPILGGQSVADKWVTPPVLSENDSLPEPDIWHVATLTDSYAMSPQVIERLEPFLTMAGELLPLRMESSEPRELYALNVLCRLDLRSVIDTSAGEVERQTILAGYESSVSHDEYEALQKGREAGDPWPVLYPAFIEENLTVGPTFFKISRLPGGWFLHDRSDEDTLLRRIESHGIKGLVLQKVWSSEAGPEPINLFRP